MTRTVYTIPHIGMNVECVVQCDIGTCVKKLRLKIKMEADTIIFIPMACMEHGFVSDSMISSNGCFENLKPDFFPQRGWCPNSPCLFLGDELGFKWIVLVGKRD